MERLLYTVEEVAKALGIGRTKLYELIGNGQLASVRIGQARRIPAGALHAFVEKLHTAGRPGVYPQDASSPLQPSGIRGTMEGPPHVEEATG